MARPVTLAYNSGKALVILAPVLTLIAVRALLEGRPHAAGAALPRRLAWAATALAFIGATAGSTALALRTAVPRPHERADELASLRSLLRGRADAVPGPQRLGRLGPARRPADRLPANAVSLRPPRRGSGQVAGGSGAAAPDVDSVVPAELDRYRYVVAPRTAYASAFPPNFEPVRRLRWFVLWKRNGPTRPRRILTEGAEPGAVLACGAEPGPGVAFVRPRPLTAGKEAWRQPDGGPPQEPGTMSPGGSLVQTLELGPGAWEISLAYSSPVDLRLRAGSLVARLPADVDDPAGLFAVGGISTRRGRDSHPARGVRPAPAQHRPPHPAGAGGRHARGRPRPPRLAAPSLWPIRRLAESLRGSRPVGIDWRRLDRHRRLQLRRVPPLVASPPSVAVTATWSWSTTGRRRRVRVSLCDAFPEVRLIERPRNDGFGSAANAGVAATHRPLGPAAQSGRVAG